MNRLFFLFALVLPVNLTAQSDWQHHVCKAGDKDYAPGHGLAQQRATEGYTVAITIGTDDWYDPALLGREASDWLKAAGVSYFSWFKPSSWPKNHLSALVGFRMKPDRRFEVCAYVNDLEGKFRHDGVVSARAGDTVFVEYTLRNDNADYTLLHNGTYTTISFGDFSSMGRQVGVGPWHGGSAPAPVKTGIWTKLVYTD